MPRLAFLTPYSSIHALPFVERGCWEWLRRRSGLPAETEPLPFAEADRLGEFDAAWFPFAEAAELPEDALGAAETMRAFAGRGGKLLLTLIGARYVGPLGVDAEPDGVAWLPEREFYWNGYVRRRRHPIFEGLPKCFHVGETAVHRPYAAARWLAAPPERGRPLAFATWGARFVDYERVVFEWDMGKGQVLAVGMHNFRFDGEVSENLERFARNILGYIVSPLTAEVTVESDGALPPNGFLGERYEGAVFPADARIVAVLTGKSWKDLEAEVRLGGQAVPLTLRTGEPFRVEVPLPNHPVPGEHTLQAEIVGPDGPLTTKERAYYVVPPDGEGVLDRHDLREIRTERLAVEVDRRTGCVWGLRDPSAERPIQYAANPDNLPALNTENHRWLGDLSLRYRFEGDTTWREWATSRATPEVTPQKDGLTVTWNAGDLQDEPVEPSVTHRLTAEGDTLRWRVTIANRGRRSLILGEAALPLALNTFFGGEVDQEVIYEDRVMPHAMVAGVSSWVLALPLGGRPPYLLLWCMPGTSLEAMAHTADYGPPPPGWEGQVTLFPFSAASRETRGWKQWYNGHTQAVIRGGGELHLDFGLRFLDGFEEIAPTLVGEGGIAFDVAPGMVIPLGMPVHVRARSDSPVRAETDAVTELAETAPGVYRIRFTGLGQRTVRFVREGGTTNLHFLAIEPIDRLAAARARFIIENQQVRRPGSRRDGMFLMWDAEENRIVDDPRAAFMSGGSDEIGFGQCMPLAWKNVVDPRGEEIEALEYYVERFLFGILQKTDTYEVAAAITDDPNETLDYTRSFNYPHVVNFYLAMSLIARRYGLTRFRDADGYLQMALRTALAYFEVPMYKDNARRVGNMGESLYFLLLDELRAHGFDEDAARLEGHMRTKGEFLLADPYPYLSELLFDTTGYSEVYFLKRLAGGLEGAEPVVRMLRATRHRQHGWPWYGGDVRWGWGCSKYPWPDELTFNYMLAHNGRALLEHFHAAGEVEDLRLGYTAFLAYWALVRPDGVAHNLYSWEPAHMSFDPWDSEMGTGLYVTLLMACAYAVEDPAFGWIGYGCDVEGEPQAGLTVRPCDGVYKRVRVHPPGLAVETSAGRIESLAVTGASLTLALRNPHDFAVEARVTISGLPDGEYESGGERLLARGPGAVEVRVPLPPQGSAERALNRV